MEQGGLRFLMEDVQYMALTFMGLVYLAKVIWLLKRPSLKDTAPPKGDPTKGAVVSLANIFMPWAMESTRVHWYFYAEFAVFHTGVALTILSSFLIPYKVMVAGDLTSRVFMVFIALAFLVGVRRLFRRLTRREIRLISSIDDYFAIATMTLYFLSALWALGTGERTALYIFFVMTTFFLLYVPFSKMSHYIMYPFSRWYYGAHFGGRGVLRGSQRSL